MTRDQALSLWSGSTNSKTLDYQRTNTATATAAKSIQSCLTLCDPTDGSPPGSPIPGILQTRKLEWVAISFSNAWKWKVKVKLISRVRLLATPWTAAYQASPSWDFPGKSTGVGCHCLPQSYQWSSLKKCTNNKCWRECGEKGTLLHCYWEYKLVQTATTVNSVAFP